MNPPIAEVHAKLPELNILTVQGVMTAMAYLGSIPTDVVFSHIVKNFTKEQFFALLEEQTLNSGKEFFNESKSD